MAENDKGSLLSMLFVLWVRSRRWAAVVSGKGWQVAYGDERLTFCCEKKRVEF